MNTVAIATAAAVVLGVVFLVEGIRARSESAKRGRAEALHASYFVKDRSSLYLVAGVLFVAAGGVAAVLGGQLLTTSQLLASLISNNALERTVNHRGALCLRERALCPAAQLGR
jgi:hypothetical protein